MNQNKNVNKMKRPLGRKVIYITFTANAKYLMGQQDTNDRYDSDEESGDSEVVSKGIEGRRL